MSRLGVNRLSSYLATRIRENQQRRRILSSSALHHASSSSSYDNDDDDAVHMTHNCIRRLKELHASEALMGEKMLRLSVEAGGCSGFQYAFSLDDEINSDDWSCSSSNCCSSLLKG